MPLLLPVLNAAAPAVVVEEEDEEDEEEEEEAAIRDEDGQAVLPVGKRELCVATYNTDFHASCSNEVSFANTRRQKEHSKPFRCYSARPRRLNMQTFNTNIPDGSGRLYSSPFCAVVG